MGLYQALDISAGGLAAQRQRVEALVQNIANARTTRTPEGGPYRRRRVVFETAAPGADFDSMLRRMKVRLAGGIESEGVRVARIDIDQSAPERRYIPEHPDAGPDGYVEFPPFNPVEDMVDLTASVRSYQANLAAIAAVKEMINRTIEIVR